MRTNLNSVQLDPTGSEELIHLSSVDAALSIDQVEVRCLTRSSGLHINVYR